MRLLLLSKLLSRHQLRVSKVSRSNKKLPPSLSRVDHQIFLQPCLVLKPRLLQKHIMHDIFPSLSRVLQVQVNVETFINHMIQIVFARFEFKAVASVVNELGCIECVSDHTYVEYILSFVVDRVNIGTVLD